MILWLFTWKVFTCSCEKEEFVVKRLQLWKILIQEAEAWCCLQINLYTFYCGSLILWDVCEEESLQHETHFRVHTCTWLLFYSRQSSDLNLKSLLLTNYSVQWTFTVGHFNWVTGRWVCNESKTKEKKLETFCSLSYRKENNLWTCLQLWWHNVMIINY